MRLVLVLWKSNYNSSYCYTDSHYALLSWVRLFTDLLSHVFGTSCLVFLSAQPYELQMWGSDTHIPASRYRVPRAGRMGQRWGWFVFRWSWSVGCCPVIAPYHDFSQDLNSEPWDSLLKVCMGNCRVARAVPHCHAVRGVLSPQIAQSSCDPMVIPYEGLGYSLLCLQVMMMIL